MKDVKVTDDPDIRKFVYDNAYVLSESEANSLGNFLDSLNQISKMPLFFFSTLNRAQLINTDSMAFSNFKEMGLNGNEGLFYLSLTTRKFKIVVGDTLHQYVSDEQLTKITKDMMPYFKEAKFYDGLVFGANEIFYEINNHEKH